MIYLIAGAPRIGKSIIAMQFAESIKTQIISTDELVNHINEPSVIFYNDVSKNILTAYERTNAVIKESKQILPSINKIIEKTIIKHQQTVIEGVHLIPIYVNDLTNKYGSDKIRVIYIGSRNIELILEGMIQNTGENDWSKGFNQDVLKQVATFSEYFSNYIYNESKKYNFHYKERSFDFKKDVESIIDDFS